MASGIGAKALLAELLPQCLIIATGSVLVFFSAFCFGAAVWLVARRGFLTIGWNV
jgi:putative membrane protein